MTVWLYIILMSSRLAFNGVRVPHLYFSVLVLMSSRLVFNGVRVPHLYFSVLVYVLFSFSCGVL
jgi:hypothetical protein